jgi:ribonuclease HI
MSERINIYTNGACPGNHMSENKGGYGAIITRRGNKMLEISGGYRNTTNQRMELKATIESLKAIDPSYPVTVYSNSEYLIKGITEWMPKWIRKAKIEKNGDLWMELYKIVESFHDIQFMHIKGHNGNIYNEEADRLATMACNYPNLPTDIEMPYYIPR